MICSWSLQLLVVTSGALIIATSTNADTQQYNGPIIYPQKSEVVLKEGQNFTIICRGKSPLNFSQQELPEEVPSISRSRMEVTVNKDTDYELIANFYEVDRFTVGFYACYDNTQDIEEVLPRDIIEEPQNTDHVSYIYIYVNGSALFAPFRLIVQAKSRSKFLIECKPTSPDINVTLTIQDLGTYRQYYNPKIGFVLESGVLNGSIAVFWFCHFEGHGKAVDTDVLVHQYQLIYLSKSTAQNKTPGPVKWVKYYPKIGFVLSKAPKSKHDMTCDANREENNSSLPIVYHGEPPPMPIISGGNAYFLKGETFTINCTVNITHLMTPIELKWFIPGNMSKVQNVSNAYELPNSHLYNNYTIYNAGPEDKGTYTCQSANHHGTKNTTFEKKFIEEPFINMTKSNVKPIIETSQKLSQVFVDIVGYPRPRIEALKDNKTLPKKVQIIEKESRPSYIRYTLRILDLKFNDSGNYTVIATNNISKSVNFDIRYKGPPVIDWDLDDIKKPRGFIAHVSCTVYGYPLPEVTWIYSQGENDLRVDAKNQNDFVETIYKVTSTVRILVQDSGKLTCLASNALGSNSSTRRFLVYEIIDGFGINNTNTWFSEHDNVVLTCVASIYDFVNVSWYGEDGEYLLNVEYSTNTYSYVAKLKFESISINEAGSYVCVGVSNDGFEDSQTINITVAENRPPKVDEPEDQNEEVLIYHPMNLTCTADAVPPPNITWFKDGLPLFEDDNVKIRESKYNQSYIQSTVYIERMEEEIVGKYYCKVSSNTISVEKVFNLALKEKPSYKEIYLSVIGAIFIVLILLVIYFSWKLRKEKQFRRELKAAGLLHFKKGATKSLNPDLGIDEQAELLPYDERFEFPADKLVLGKQLGAGAFGVVYKAEARGIINAEETTTVAVKMVKKTADNMYIKALASELKIMVHLGKHVNIVNLLGACTKNVAKRELIVIVEYCKYGNIHNYLQKHREVFIDQLTDNSEKSFGKINRGFSCSSGNSGTHSEYFGSNHTQDTDHTFLNTANTSRSGRKDNNKKQVEFVKVSETGYVQPEWRSNYESDYSFDGRSPRPLCSRDLLTWAFQIARGMEYLASRKVLHGDLAARNVLLADDNVVKICDFGLARSIYKNDEYQKKENSPLPVKWLAIECMTDRIFSTQSDVWSFGIVLWELFTLAKTPYPNVSPPSLLEYLSDGHRLEKPRYADDKLYDVMKQCWEKKPNARPTFSRLQEILGSFLEESVRNHYVDLNATYIDMNVKRDGEDYLAMVHAPDYNNMVTPNLHHYVNEANQFFPKTPTLQHDDEGYLRMSPATFNARPPATKFDFDKKLSPRVPEPNSYGSELTPMLTLNNLPRSGSESDQDGSNSPYLNMCPRIDEETDEVFETKQNNLKNTQSSAVTNPTYITFTPDDEKKSQNITNNYINVPNGLVK